MPRYNIERRPTRADRAQQQTQLDIAQQQADSGQQNDWINQAVKLYGLQQDRLMQPERLRAAGLANTGAEFEQAWAQPRAEQAFAGNALQQQLAGQAGGRAEAMAPHQIRGAGIQNDMAAHDLAWAQPNSEARYNATNALSGQRDAKTGPSLQELLMLKQYAPHLVSDDDLAAVMGPEAQARHATTKAQKEAETQAKIAKDLAEQGGGGTGAPVLPRDPYQQMMADLLENLRGKAARMPGTGEAMKFLGIAPY